MIKQKLEYSLSIICGTALAGAFFIAANLFKNFGSKDFAQILLVIGFVIAPLLIESIGSFGLTQGWFNHWIMHKGKVMEILQWIAGVFGAAAIFDAVMRIFKKIHMPDNAYWFSVDVIFLIVFVMWMVVSHYLNSHVRTGGKCKYC